MHISPTQQDERSRILAEIAEVGPVLPGNLTERHLTCTHGGCHCHDSPPKLHGPYWYLTRKVSGKTVTKMLSPEQGVEYTELVNNARRLRSLVHDLEALGLKILDDDPRTPRRR